MQKLILILLFSALQINSAWGARRQLAITPKNVTVSGVSAGAYVAVQMHMAFSSIIVGSASVAGGVYWCAKGSSITAQVDCMSVPKTESPEEPLARLKAYEREGLVDPTSNLQRHKMFIFASRNDSKVNARNSVRLENFAKELMPAGQIAHMKHAEAAHGFPTQNFGNPCAREGVPWMLNCKLDLAGIILKNFYGNLNPPAPFRPENLSSFSQKEFDTDGRALLFPTGWIYVPTSCRNGQTCRLHMALHGCQMNPEFVQDTYVKNAGYNEWAESNNIVVLYPQASKPFQNPQACWDWFGLTGPDYANKKGPQMQALMKMIQMLATQQRR